MAVRGKVDRGEHVTSGDLLFFPDFFVDDVLMLTAKQSLIVLDSKPAS